MIIQAGFDLELLARPLIVQEDKLLPRLVVIGLDAEMQLESIKLASEHFTGKLEPQFDAILDELEPQWTRYFAIAHAGIWAEDCPPWEVPIIQEAADLNALATQAGFRMIGHIGIDAMGYMCDGPHSYFDQYRLGNDLPCTMSHWVHSSYRGFD
jgi:hypothetical protein